MALTAIEVQRKRKPGRYAAGDGAYLQVAAGGTKTWVFRYQRDGNARHMGLGPVSLVSLADARQAARDARKQLLAGIDPLAARDASRAALRAQTARAMTFQSAAEKYIAANSPAWKNAKHAAQWTSTLKAYAYPHFGNCSVADVDTALVTKAIEPIWATKSETAGRVRQRIESVLDWAAARGYRTKDNPARWDGHLDQLLPSRRKVRAVEHHAALPYSDMADFMAALRERLGIGPRALEFAILTAARTGEVIGATWPEIDLDKAIWTVPAKRMKGDREHRVPLSPAAIALLEDLPREAEFVFMGGRAGKPLSNMALLETLRRMERDDLTAHGFRSTFRDWGSDTTAYPRELLEMALAHTISDKTEAAYRRSDMFEKRRRLMADWATFCSTPARTGDVVPIRGDGHG